MRIIIYGPQGSGKSTQAQLLGQKLNLPVISTGEISRQISTENTPEGIITKELIDRGEPTPPEILNPRLEKVLAENSNGYILDGFPRFSNQLYLLEEWLAKTETKIDKVILINLPNETGIKRLMSRAAIEGRADDTEESIKRRVELYVEQTQPIIDFFRGKGVLVEVDGVPGIEEINASIVKLF